MTSIFNSFGKLGTTLFLLIFALGFPLGGISFGVLPMYKQFEGVWQAKSYVPVPAMVLKATLSSRGSKTTTYRAEAQFAYEYDGQQYLGSTINLSDNKSDNIGSYQQDIYRELLDAYNHSTPVTLWVNPQEPAQAVYDRTIRWAMVIFLIPFAVLFPAVGVAAWWMIWRVWRANSNADAFAVQPQANQSVPTVAVRQSIQGDASAVKGLLVFSFFWNLLSWPIAILFFMNLRTDSWWVMLFVCIFPIIGMVMLGKAFTLMRAQWRIGKPVLALLEPGIAGRFPLQGQIEFLPALGTRLNAAEPTHTVTISLQHVYEDRRGDNINRKILWQGQALNASMPRGTHSVNFKIDLPGTITPGANAASPWSSDYWQIVLNTLGSEIKYRLPAQAINTASALALNDAATFAAQQQNAKAIKLAAKMHWLVQGLMLIAVGYFVWSAVSDFGIPLYQSRNKPTSTSNQPDKLAERSQLPKIHAPFLLDSLYGNGFGVVAKAAGKMVIGDNTVTIIPESIELKSYGNCAPACPLIRQVKFSLTKSGAEHFSTIAQGVPIAVQQTLPDVLNLTLHLPTYAQSLVLNFKDRDELANLRLTLEIDGEVISAGNPVQASWYTHAEPFPVALGHSPVSTVPSNDPEQRSTQAMQAVLKGQADDVKRLLEAGVDANARDADGETMLMRAANRGDISTVNLLLAHGADANARTPVNKEGLGSMTALHAALRQDSVDVVEALLKAGANPRAEANGVWTPAHYAAYRGAVKTIRSLHQHKVSIDEPFHGARGSTPLMVAAQFAQVPTIQLLLELGADPKRKDLYGEDACGYAKFFQKAASMEALKCK